MKSIFRKKTRFDLACTVAVCIAIFINSLLFFLYEAKYCHPTIEKTKFFKDMFKFLYVYQIFKEIVTRVAPITILVISNVILILIVKKSREKTRKKSISTVPNRSKGMNKRPIQENQLTKMTIFVSTLYIATVTPMIFAFPGLVFSDTETKVYKTYAALANILELLQCSCRFVIYICFTRPFRDCLFDMFNYKRYFSLKLSTVNLELAKVDTETP